MIVDPFDRKQGITPSGKPASQAYCLPAGVSPTARPSEAHFIGLVDTSQPAQPEPCDHHWVSAHQADFPTGIHWVRQCSQCQRIDGADLTVQMDKAIRTIMLTVESPEDGA